MVKNSHYKKKNSEKLRDLSTLSGNGSFEITMPKTGEFWIGIGICSNGRLRVWNKSYEDGVDYEIIPHVDQFIRMQYPCNKGDIISVEYNNAKQDGGARFLILY